MSDVVNMATRTVSNPSEKGLQRYVGLEHIQPNTIRITEWGDIQDGTSFTKCFSEGQVLLSRRRVYLRKAAIADFSGICSGDILVFECDPQRLLPEYLVLILHSDGFIGYSLEKAAGSLSPRIKWQDIKKFSFRLPSITVQRRLSSQLEDVLRLHQELKRALENSIRYTISMQQICTTSLVTLQWAGGSETDHGVH
jgi:type I restriction enzyme S subunit